MTTTTTTAGPGSARPLAEPDLYLTDGSNLYRVAVEVAHPAGLVWLEDCYTLSFVLVTAHDMDALRPVVPAA